MACLSQERYAVFFVDERKPPFFYVKSSFPSAQNGKDFFCFLILFSFYDIAVLERQALQPLP